MIHKLHISQLEVIEYNLDRIIIIYLKTNLEILTPWSPYREERLKLEIFKQFIRDLRIPTSSAPLIKIFPLRSFKIKFGLKLNLKVFRNYNFCPVL